MSITKCKLQIFKNLFHPWCISLIFLVVLDSVYMLFIDGFLNCFLTIGLVVLYLLFTCWILCSFFFISCLLCSWLFPWSILQSCVSFACFLVVCLEYSLFSIDHTLHQFLVLSINSSVIYGLYFVFFLYFFSYCVFWWIYLLLCLFAQTMLSPTIDV